MIHYLRCRSAIQFADGTIWRQEDLREDGFLRRPVTDGDHNESSGFMPN